MRGVVAGALPAALALLAGQTAPAGAATANSTVNAVATHSGLCLTVENSSVLAGARILQANCTGQRAAEWVLEQSSAGGGSVRLKNVNSGLCLEVENSSGALGAAVVQADCADRPGSVLDLVDRGDRVWIQPRTSTPRRCLEVTGGSPASGVPLVQQACADQRGSGFHQRLPRAGNDPGDSLPQSTRRLSVTSEGAQTTGSAGSADITPDGRHVALTATATDLVTGAASPISQVFLRDRKTNATERVSVASNGDRPNKSASEPSLSADGRFVSFVTAADNLTPGDANQANDVFVRDRQTGLTRLISAKGGGTPASGSSHSAELSADGRFVVFASAAGDLLPGDTNNVTDVFVHDRQTGVTERVSRPTGGGQSNAESNSPSISADGRFVTFTSRSAQLVAGDTNDASDVFVHDRQSGTTERVSLAASGGQGNAASYGQSGGGISADGRHIVFQSQSSNLAPSDTDPQYDVFVRDRQTGTTEHVNVNSQGVQGGAGWLWHAVISADGRHVAFDSAAPSLAPGDTNGLLDVFVRDRQNDTTERISVADDGAQGTQSSLQPAISGDGRLVVFSSGASELVPQDTNDAYDLFLRDRGVL